MPKSQTENGSTRTTDSPDFNRNVHVPNAISHRKSSEVSLAAGFVLLLAILFTGSAIFSLQKNQIFATVAVPIQAEVVELVKERLPSADNVREEPRFAVIPVFQYKVDGTVFERRADARKISTTNYAVGDTTTIYYNPENPSEIRDVLGAESSKAPAIFATLAASLWTLFVALAFDSLRRRRQEKRRHATTLTDASASRGRTEGPATNTKCVFIALETTSERIQSARRIKLVCRWVHPETGIEWFLRSSSLHPAELPPKLEVGSLIDCKVDFENPSDHEVFLSRAA